MDFLKELLALKEDEAIAAGEMKVDDQVHNQLDKAAEEEDIDAQCFGLEMEDGKVVKVYVKQDVAEDFEAAMSKRLGEDDDIKTALDELGKEFEIIEVVWPDEEPDEEEEDDEDDETSGDDESGKSEEDGADSLDDEVNYDDDEESKKEALTVGQRFSRRLQELKWTDEEDGEYSRAAAKGAGNEDEDDPDKNIEPAEPKQTEPEGIESKWKIDKDDDGITIANDRFSIELDDDEMMSLMNAIADKKIARFKNEHGRVVYVFSPKGSDYILKTPEYQGGFRIPKDVVNKIMD